MPTITPEDELRMLYTAIKTSKANVQMSAVANIMGLKEATAGYRYRKLMTRMEEMYGSGDGALPVARAEGTGAAKGRKRKETDDSGGNSGSKKEKNNNSDDADAAIKEEQSTREETVGADEG